MVVPLATVLVLGVFPLWADALLKEMVIRFKSQFGCRSNVVLDYELDIFHRREKTHVNTPKFFHGVKSNYFFEKLVPEIAL